MSEEFAGDLAAAIKLDGNGELGDIQVYPVSETLEHGSAAELVDAFRWDHDDDLSEDDPDLSNSDRAWLDLLKCAEALDTEAEKDTGPLTHHLVEFVWENGGGDDNAFAQTVSVSPGASAVNAAFFEALGDYLHEGVGYSFCYETQEDKSLQVMELKDALQCLWAALKDLNDDDVKPDRVRTLAESLKLDRDTAPASRLTGQRRI